VTNRCIRSWRAAPLWLLAIPTLLIAAAPTRGTAIFRDDFEHGLGQWTVSRAPRIRTVPSGDSAHGQVMLLEPDGDDVLALVKGSESWRGVRFEGDVLFPTNESNYLGVAYNYQRRAGRADFGVIYIKGNDSYLQANPHRDFNVSRTFYPEYTAPLTGAGAIVMGRWQRFRVEVVGTTCHFYVGDMTTPAMTFPHFEQASGAIGLQPRSVGGPVWVDNAEATPIDRLSYSGDAQPSGFIYARESLLTSWDVAGPFTATDDAIARDPEKSVGTWRPFATDARGAVVTARVTDFHAARTVAYLRTRIMSPTAGPAALVFSTVDDLALWMNGRFNWFVPRAAAAWYDFATNPKHAGQKIPIDLREGANDVVLRVRGGAYAAGGFFVRLER
jgi:hypothetical protein